MHPGSLVAFRTPDPGRVGLGSCCVHRRSREPRLTKFPREFVRDVVDRTSIVSLVSQHVKLKRRGSAWLGLCPFHNEKTPSFHVNEDRKNYHCFGCNESGDAIDWLKEVEGLSFLDAVKELADRAGVPLPKQDLSPQELEKSRRREALLRANEVACAWFQEMLEHPTEGEFARDYLKDRGYTLEFARQWRVGYAPESWDGLRDALARARLDDRIGVEASLLKRSDRGKRPYAFFRNRLMFPILGSSKKVIAFGGRTLGDDKAKYINSTGTPVYDKSGALYGLQQGRKAIHKEDRVLVVEGYFDVMALARSGLGFAVAPCGTALTDRQLAGIRRHTRNVTLLFDADQAGRRAALRALELCLEQGLWPMRLEVPNGKDPDEFVKDEGPEAMRALLDESRPLLDFYLDVLAADVRSGASQADKALEDVAPLIARLGAKNARQSHYVHAVHAALAIEHRYITDAVQRAARRIASQPKRTEVVLPARRAKAAEQTPPPRRRSSAPRGPAGPPGRFGPEDDFVPPDEAFMPPEDFLPEDLRGPASSAPPPQGPRPVPAPPEPKPTPPQLQLLRLLVQDLPNVAGAVQDYGVTAWIPQPTILKLVDRFLEAHRDGREPTATDLLEEVGSGPIRSTLGQVLASKDAWYDDDILETATQECLLRLRREYVAARYVQIKRDLDALQRSGNGSGLELLELGQESIQLQKEREALDQHLSRN